MFRRKLIASLLHINEQTDRTAAIATTIYVLWLIIYPYLPLPIHLAELLHIGVVVLEVLVAMLLIAYWGAHLALKNPNRRWLLVLSDAECKSLLRWLSSGTESALLDGSYCKVQFADPLVLEELTRLNYEAFRGTAYEASKEQFRLRNAGFIEQNEKCFLLFIDPIGKKQVIGYSCLVPLNELGTQLYLEGSVSDATLRKELIATANEQPTSVLLFALHLREEFSLTKSGASRKYSLYFWSCVRYHFRAICGKAIDMGSGVDIYVQTQELSLARRLTKRMGFSDTGAKSKDGYKILHIRLPRPGG